jgi:alpha-D-ribose 1-methylphosphonate 5-triphosphate synthase subunit PhnG
MTVEQSLPAGGAPASERQRLMALCTHATEAELAAGLAAARPMPDVAMLRRPELGLVMLRGRIGGVGAPFNLGEATVARAAVRLSSGEMGVSCILGRSLERARLAAIVDALAQVPGHRSNLDKALFAPVAERRKRERDLKDAQTAATRVDFFTLVRGED